MQARDAGRISPDVSTSARFKRREGRKMATKAYLLITVAREFCQCQDEYQDVLKELEVMPEVESIEPVNGVCDFLVQVEAPVRVIFVADKILAKKWVERLCILRVQPFQFNKDTSTRELLKARSALAR